MKDHKIKAWDKKKERMIGQQWVLPNLDNRLEILRLSGANDKNGVDIGEYDVLYYNHNRYIALYDNNMLRWILKEIVSWENKTYCGLQEELTSEMARNMEIVGTMKSGFTDELFDDKEVEAMIGEEYREDDDFPTL